MAPIKYPHPNPSKSYWIEEGPNHLKKHRTTKELPTEVDLVIIGSGYSGTSVASHLLLSNKSEKGEPFNGSILMLESRDVCAGATGRNGGHIRGNYQSGQASFIENFGEKIAADMVIFEHNELHKVKKLVEDLKIDCNFNFRYSSQTFDDEKTYEAGLNDFYAYQNNKYIPQYLKDMIQIKFKDDNDPLLQHKVGPFSITAPTSSVWPYKLVTTLLAKCIEKGLNLQTYTTVLNIQRGDNNTWLVNTERGVVKCKKLVCATNAYTRTLLPEFKGKIIPVKGVVSHIKQISKEGEVNEDINRLHYNYYHTFPLEGDYVTTHSNNSIIAGGGGKTYLPYPNSIDMFNNMDDSYAPKETINYFKNYPNKFYPEFAKDTKFENDYTWTGCMAYSNDDVPYVGDLTNFGRKNVFILAGYTGHGMPRIWSCGEYIADLITGSKASDVPDCFKLTLERMYNHKHDLFSDLAGYDINNRGKFKL